MQYIGIPTDPTLRYYPYRGKGQWHPVCLPVTNLPYRVGAPLQGVLGNGYVLSDMYHGDTGCRMANRVTVSGCLGSLPVG